MAVTEAKVADDDAVVAVVQADPEGAAHLLPHHLAFLGEGVLGAVVPELRPAGRGNRDDGHVEPSVVPMVVLRLTTVDDDRTGEDAAARRDGVVGGHVCAW